MPTDTIAAISTAVAEGGIGIIRISGPDAIAVADRVFLCGKKKEKPEPAAKAGGYLAGCPSHTIHYGHIVDDEGVVDEVLVSVLRAPRSYTAEDTVEINCHGGIFAMRQVLECVLAAGARAAEPGEFTRRAFLNGRIDLSRAEAVMDVIQAKNKYALQNSVRQLGGSLYKKIEQCRAQLLSWMAEIEAALDDPEHLCLDGFSARIRGPLVEQVSLLSALRASFRDGRLLQEGIPTAIVGRPNAGKSSLLNLLLGEERAIVTEIAGTTRDVLQEKVNLDGITLNIADTAGIRASGDRIEQIGVEKAREKAESAELVLFVLDASQEPDAQEEEILRMVAGKKGVLLLNKTDLAVKTDVPQAQKMLNAAGADMPVIPFSAKTESGLAQLKETITAFFFEGRIGYQEEVMVTNLRQAAALDEARDALEQVIAGIETQLPEDFLSIDLRAACDALGKITGETVGEDLAEEIFAKFCMGK